MVDFRLGAGYSATFVFGVVRVNETNIEKKITGRKMALKLKVRCGENILTGRGGALN